MSTFLKLRMIDQNILQWKLLRESSNSSEQLQEYSAIHFFNLGESAYLIKDGHLYICSKVIPQVEFNQVLSSNRVMQQLVPSNQERLSIKALHLNNHDKIGCCDYNGIKAIATGNFHTVLLDSAGHIFCWGSNRYGQLGLGHCMEVNNKWKRWKTNLENIDQIACGENFTIALSKCDELWFWGSLSFNGTEVMFHVAPTLIEINGDPVPKSISAGDHHFAVLTEDSKVYMMGNNEHGQLALGHRNVFKQPELVPFEHELVHVQCAFKRTIFLTTANALYMCDSTTENAVKCISNAHKIVSLATHWRTPSFVAVDECGFFYKPRTIDDKFVLLRTSYHDISDGFIDYGTPSVYWPVNALVGSTKTSCGLTTLTCNMPVVNYASRIDISHLYNSQIYSDIGIKLSDGVIYAHKLVLALRSPYLEKMLSETDRKEKFLDMTNMNAAVYKAYINFLYTGKVQLDSVVDLPELYLMAEKDENDMLKAECELLWSNNLNKDNIVKAYKKAYLLNSKVLIERCSSSLNLNLQYILNSEEYNSLDVPVKLALLTTAATHRVDVFHNQHTSPLGTN